MKRSLILLLFFALLLTACGPLTPVPTESPTITPAPVTGSQTLTVFAAASLTNAFGEMGKLFEAAHPGVKVKFNFGGSQALRTQIEQGAAADVFASANTKEMDALEKGNFVRSGSPQTFLANRLVVVLPANNPGKLSELADLAKPGVKVVLGAKEVPVGNYALQVLDKLDKSLGNGYKDKVLANVVSYENDVKQVVAKVQLGEADAGIVYASDVIATPGIMQIAIPSESNAVANYPIAALLQSKNPELAQAFVDYVLSDEGQSILQKWGFLPIK